MIVAKRAAGGLLKESRGREYIYEGESGGKASSESGAKYTKTAQ